MEVHKSTALRLLQSLEKEGFVRQLADGRYGVGLAVIPMAQVATDQLDFRATAHPHLRALAESSGNTVHFAQLIGDEVYYIDKVEGSASLSLGSRMGASVSRHTAGVAKVILAQLPAARRQRIIDQIEFKRFTPNTITSPQAFARQLELVRQRGWAEDDGEQEPYIACVAIPIHEASGKVPLGMSVTALSAVTPLKALRDAIPEYCETALAISRELGWKGTHAHDRR
jgi:DNA-binding IclR family transcriptional regulator